MSASDIHWLVGEFHGLSEACGYQGHLVGPFFFYKEASTLLQGESAPLDGAARGGACGTHASSDRRR